MILLSPAHVKTAVLPAFEAVSSALIDGDPPWRIRFVSTASAEVASFRLHRDGSTLAQAVEVQVHGASGAAVAVPELPVYSGSTHNGSSWVHATLSWRAGPAAVGSWDVDALVGHAGGLYAVASHGGARTLEHSSSRGHGRATTDAEAVRVTAVSAAHRRALSSQLPPYSRLAGCPAALLEATVGLVLDAGFVEARGGVEPAIVAAAAAVSRTNAVYEQQLGLRLRVGALLVNAARGNSAFAATGPNAAPAGGAGTRTCAEYASALVSGHGVAVDVAGPHLALSRLAYWVQQQYAGRGLEPSTRRWAPDLLLTRMGSSSAQCGTA